MFDLTDNDFRAAILTSPETYGRSTKIIQSKYGRDWRRKWHPLQCSCLENPRDCGACGLPSMGSHRVRHD